MINESTKWGTISGVWGDIIVSLGYFKEKIGHGNIIYLGNNKAIVDFLSCQDFIHEVKQIPESIVNAENWNQYWMQAVFSPDSKIDDMFPYLSSGISKDIIVPTHITYKLMQPDQPVVQWSGGNLPVYAKDWASEYRKQLPKWFFIFQPYSLNSNPLHRHWNYWKYLALQLESYTPHAYVTVGTNWFPVMKNKVYDTPQFHNMVDKIPDMACVMALAELSSGIITTSNSLAHWAQVQSIPSVVICNKTSSRDEYMYRRVLEWPSLTVLHHDSSLDDAFNTVGERLFCQV